jgi:DNA gyrase inhibitor GyrI
MHSKHTEGTIMPTTNPMHLTEIPEPATWPETHYVFLEKIGPFQNTAPQAWHDVHQLTKAISAHNQITGAMSLYKMEKQIYRAGFILSAPPKDLPVGLSYEAFKGGKYIRFTLTGPYKHLPEASGRVFHIVKESRIPLRDDFNIENYVNDPKTTPEDQLITEILFPTAG